MSNGEPDEATERRRVLRAVAANQILWTVGYSLTTGSFLLYFAREFGAKGFAISLLLALPETAGVFGLVTRSVLRRFENRKCVFVAATILARLAALPIVLLPFLGDRFDGAALLAVLCGCVAATYAIGAVAYVAYLSWLSDLLPEARWGRMFARREIAKLAVLLVLPVAVGYLRDELHDRGRFTTLGYAAIFATGQAFLLASVAPLLRLSDEREHDREAPELQFRGLGARNRGTIASAFANRTLRPLLLHNWCLSFANGLTQSAFFLYSAEFGPLAIGLGTYNLMTTLMRLVQIPVSRTAGGVCDARGSLAPRFWGVLIGSTGVVFWLLATPRTWWLLWGAFLLWGAYGAANVAGDKLMLLHAPRGDDAAQIALFTHGGGLLSGVSGLLGGLWLDRLRETGFGTTFDLFGHPYRFEGYQLIFAVSLAGRYASLAWLLPLRNAAGKARESRESTRMFRGANE